MTDRPPTLRERRLAAELRRLRERTTLNLDQVVTGLQMQSSGRWSAAKLSRVETAAQRIKTADLNQLLDLYKVEGNRREALLALACTVRQRGWWDAYADVIHADYASYIELEAEAKALRCYDALAVHGLLQTEEYAHEIIKVGLMHLAPASEVDRRVEIRRTRQQALTEPAPEPLRLWSIIDEGALHRVVGGPEVMRPQYEHLLEAARLPNVMLQVLPHSAGAHPAVGGAFTIMEFTRRHIPDVVYLDGMTGALYVEDDAQVHTYSLAFDRLGAAALGADESLAMISRLAKDGR